MNRKFLLLIFVIFISVAVRAEISQHTAFGIALEWFKNSGFEVSRSNNDVESIPLSSLDNDNSYYIFNNSHGAYVIISGYDEENPIIGYSKESEWDNENIPPFLEEMLSNYKEAYLSRSGLPMPQMVNTRQDKSVYHKTANWGQGQPYNDMVDNKYPIGCVATAIAIVLRHYESPLPGNGTHSYLAPFKNETYSFDFNRKFDWNKMPMDMPKMGYSEDEAKAISELCFAAAVASDMSFTPNASGAIARPYSIQKFFNYSQDIISHRSDYNELESLQEIIYEDLENGRIVICSGGGHCFVCDGYEGEFFHFNFGWDGNDNGYFRLSDIAPVENGYPYVNFITGIHPANEMDVEGTPWRIAKGSLDAVGITVRAERIEKGKQYDFSINDLQSQMEYPYKFEGDLGLALFNSEHEIREILCSNELIFGCFYGDNYQFFNNVEINTDLSDEDYIAVVARPLGSDKWSIVPVERGLRPTIKVSDTGIKCIPVIWDLGFGDYTYEDYGNNNQTFAGTSYEAKINFPISHTLKGCILNDMPCKVNPYNYDPSCCGLSFLAKDGVDKFTIRPVSYLEEDELDNYEITVNEGNSVKTSMNKDDFIRLTGLNVKGVIDEDDFKLFQSLPNIKRLNLYNATIGGKVLNKIPDVAFQYNEQIESITLPKTTSTIGRLAFVWSSLKSLHFGPNVSVIMSEALRCAELEEFYVEMPESIEVEPNAFESMDLDKVILYVPVGTKRLYKTSPYAWRKFKNIVEYDYSSSVIPIVSNDTLKFTSNHESLTISTDCPLSIIVSDLKGRVIISEQISDYKTFTINSGIYILRTSDGKSYKIAIK